MLTKPCTRVLRKRASSSLRALALVLGIGCVLGGTVVAGDESQPGEVTEGQPTNLQVSISRHGEYFEIELRSTRDFPARALPPILQIGDRFFRYSRYTADGRPDTLIFRVPVEEFDSLQSGAPVTVFYSNPDPESIAHMARAIAEGAVPTRVVWRFGAFRKELYRPSDGEEPTDR